LGVPRGITPECRPQKTVYSYRGAYTRNTPVAAEVSSCGAVLATGTASGFLHVVRTCVGTVEIVEEGTGCTFAVAETAASIFEQTNATCVPPVDAGYGAVGVTLRRLTTWRVDLAAMTFSYAGELHWAGPEGQSTKACMSLDATLAVSGQTGR
jgi:hypothetical protein